MTTEFQKAWNRMRPKISFLGGCWHWTASKDGKGYGRLGGSKLGSRAHRISFQIFRGPIPPGMFVCHTCDNPSCVRPSHLFLGTNHDNVEDMKAKGRSPINVGSRNPRCKITDSDVIAIRSSIEKGTVLARLYGVDPATISQIRHRKSWAHIKETVSSHPSI